MVAEVASEIRGFHLYMGLWSGIVEGDDGSVCITTAGRGKWEFRILLYALLGVTQGCRRFGVESRTNTQVPAHGPAAPFLGTIRDNFASVFFAKTNCWKITICEVFLT